MGIAEILTIIFVVLKLVGVISWSWWVVFLPLIIALGLYVLSIAISVMGLFRMSRRIKKDFDDF